MMLDTLVSHVVTMLTVEKRFQGRSKKKLQPIVTYRGGIYVARWAGRGNKFFGNSPQVALKNLQAGGQ